MCAVQKNDRERELLKLHKDRQQQQQQQQGHLAKMASLEDTIKQQEKVNSDKTVCLHCMSLSSIYIQFTTGKACCLSILCLDD